MAQDLPMSDAFYEELARIVEANMEKEQFGVNDLVQEIGLSHSQIHRKLKLLTGQTISQFIREIRLQRAHELLQDHLGTASEIAFKVGFSSPTYFNKCFKDFFGYPPGSILRSESAQVQESLEGTETGFQQTLPQPVSKPASKMKAFFIVGVLAMLALSYFWYTKATASQETTKTPAVIADKSIAVLPFRNDSPDSGNQYFCDGMMDEIRTHLQKIADLKVKSRTQVEPYRNTTQSFTTIARELNAAYLLEGAVRKYGNRFRITAQLIDVSSKNNLWAGSYDGTISDSIFMVQSNIAKEIAASLNAVITPNEKRSIDQFPTSNVAAYDAYISGRHQLRLYWKTHQKNHIKTAHELFDIALKLDGKFLEAMARKGEAFLAEQRYDSVLHYVEKALALNPEFSRAYGMKGECYRWMGKSDEAIENFTKAISLSPPGSDELGDYHWLLARVYSFGKKDLIRAIPHYKTAIEMSVGLYSVYLDLGRIFLGIGDYNRAEIYQKRGIKLENCFSILQYNASLQAQGKFQEALQFNDSICQQTECNWACKIVLFQTAAQLKEFELAEEYYYQLQSDPASEPFMHLTNNLFGYVQDQLGKKEEAAKTYATALVELNSMTGKDFHIESQNIMRSEIYAVNGNGKEALKYLAEYAKLGFKGGWHDFILITPTFESLRDDPEFKAIVKQAQEEKAIIRARIREMELRGELDF